MKLSCSQIYLYDEFIKHDEEFKCPGVYIWGFMVNEIFSPYYVGKHQTSILSRIKKHWSHELPIGNHHILKDIYLDDFPSKIKVNKVVKALSQNDFATYENYFAYLNIDSKSRKAKNSKKDILKNNLNYYNQNLLPHIQNYQNRFYVCCIPCENNIPELEKHVFFKLKPKVGVQFRIDKLKQFEIEFPQNHHLAKYF